MPREPLGLRGQGRWTCQPVFQLVLLCLNVGIGSSVNPLPAVAPVTGLH